MNQRGITLQTTVVTAVLALAAAAAGIVIYNVISGESQDISENAATTKDLNKFWEEEADDGDNGIEPISDDEQEASVTRIYAGANHTCIVPEGYDAVTGLASTTTQTRTTCWGDSTHRQVGKNSAPSDTNYHRVYSLATRVLGSFISNPLGGLDLGSSLRVPVDSKYEVPTGNYFFDPIYEADTKLGIKDMALGDNHTCAITAADTVRCWGKNDEKQAGVDTGSDTSYHLGATSYSNEIYLSLYAGQRAKAIYAGVENSCAVTTAERIYCWGHTSNRTRKIKEVVDDMDTGEPENLEDWDTEHYLAIELDQAKIAADTQVHDVAIGQDHICALISNYDGNAANEVYCWGRDKYGQIGKEHNGDRGTTIRPGTNGVSKIDGLTGATEISAGHFHNCAVTSTAELKCWGLLTSDYALGTALAEDTDFHTAITPEALPSITGVIDFDTSRYNTCVLTASLLKCFGNLQVSWDFSAETIKPVALAVGYEHLCVVMDDTKILCIGDNALGQLAIPQVASGGPEAIASSSELVIAMNLQIETDTSVYPDVDTFATTTFKDAPTPPSA